MYEVIIIGAGSVGTPIAMSLAARGYKPLVIDSGSSAGQGNNKCAIGGVRATHSDPAKVALSVRVYRVINAKKWNANLLPFYLVENDADINPPLDMETDIKLDFATHGRVLFMPNGWRAIFWILSSTNKHNIESLNPLLIEDSCNTKIALQYGLPVLISPLNPLLIEDSCNVRSVI